MIEDSLSKRRHVIEYSKEIIPSKDEIEEILRVGYKLASSKQNAFPFKIFVLGPDSKRSKHLHELTEGHKIKTDGDLPADASYFPNPNLLHIKTSPYTLIITPRLSPPNAYHKIQIEKHGNNWEFDKIDRIKPCGKAFSLEVGIIATTITGAAIDRGWDSAYCVCFPKKMDQWFHFPYVEYAPYLIQTIGKADKFKQDYYSKASLELDTRPNFETIFNFVDDQ